MSSDRIVYLVKAEDGKIVQATFQKAEALATKGKGSLTIEPLVVDVVEVRQQIEARLSPVERLIMFPEKDTKQTR